MFVFTFFNTVEDDVHYFSGVIAVFKEQVAIFFSVVGDVAHTVKSSTFDIFQRNCFVDGLTQEDDALVGYEEVAKFVEHGSFFFNGGVFNVRTFKGNSFINAEFTGKFKVVVFLFNNFAFAEPLFA